jgi:CubicO group peptidase (beta-lactamase class C family)
VRQRTVASVLLGIGCLLSAHSSGAETTRGLDPALLNRAFEHAAGQKRLHALIVARDGKIMRERAFRGPGLNRPTNIKSASKSIISALVGIAIDRGVIEGSDQPASAFLAEYMPRNGDPRLRRITVGNLLSMQAGLERTSGRNYGRWVQSRDWVRHALSRPFADEPGGSMLYSTGSTHLLSAILTKAAGRSTLALARDWLGEPLGIDIPAWERDPQGIYLGGNNMLLSPRALLRFGELYRNGGLHDGKQVLSEGWIRKSWETRTHSRFSAHPYGYGWFKTGFCGHTAPYARGFGGQFVYVIPSLGMTVVITSDRSARTRIGGYRDRLTSLMRDDLVPAAIKADGGVCIPAEQKRRFRPMDKSYIAPPCP